MEIEKWRVRSMEKWEQRDVDGGGEWGRKVGRGGKGVCEWEGCTRG